MKVAKRLENQHPGPRRLIRNYVLEDSYVSQPPPVLRKLPTLLLLASPDKELS